MEKKKKKSPRCLSSLSFSEGAGASSTCGKPFFRSLTGCNNLVFSAAAPNNHVKDRLLKANHNFLFVVLYFFHVKDRLLKANHNPVDKMVSPPDHVKDRLLKANHNGVVTKAGEFSHVKDRLLKANHNYRLTMLRQFNHVKDRLLKANHNDHLLNVSRRRHVKDRLLKANHNAFKVGGAVVNMSKIVY